MSEQLVYSHLDLEGFPLELLEDTLVRWAHKPVYVGPVHAGPVHACVRTRDACEMHERCMRDACMLREEESLVRWAHRRDGLLPGAIACGEYVTQRDILEALGLANVVVVWYVDACGYAGATKREHLEVSR